MWAIFLLHNCTNDVVTRDPAEPVPEFRLRLWNHRSAMRLSANFVKSDRKPFSCKYDNVNYTTCIEPTAFSSLLLRVIRATRPFRGNSDLASQNPKILHLSKNIGRYISGTVLSASLLEVLSRQTISRQLIFVPTSAWLHDRQRFTQIVDWLIDCQSSW